MKMFELRKERGFSLVELMIVVAIIAILAAIAIPAFMRFALKSKTSEATGNLAAIRTCEESYRAEEDVYLKAGPNPGGAPSSLTRAWLANGDFDLIGFEPDGAVRYTYQVAEITDPNVFAASAEGNLDDKAPNNTYTITKGDDVYPKPVQSNPGEF